MANVYDIADFFIELAQYDDNDTITNMRINKLLYFSQAWYMVRYNTPLFDEEFEAWDFGPVVPCIYQKYKSKGKNNISKVSDGFSADIFSENEIMTLLDVAKYYGQFSTSSLVARTHTKGTPWANVYKKGENNIINKESILLYFKHEFPLESFSVPKNLYDTAVSGQRTSDGLLLLPKDFDDDDE